MRRPEPAAPAWSELSQARHAAASTKGRRPGRGSRKGAPVSQRRSGAGRAYQASESTKSVGIYRCPARRLLSGKPDIGGDVAPRPTLTRSGTGTGRSHHPHQHETPMIWVQRQPTGGVRQRTRKDRQIKLPDCGRYLESGKYEYPRQSRIHLENLGLSELRNVPVRQIATAGANDAWRDRTAAAN
jgi:hypothetical protein